MADRSAPTAEAHPITGLASLLTFPFHLFGILCGSLLLAIMVEWIGMHFLWPQASCCHAEQMLSQELDQLSSTFRQSLIVSQPMVQAQRLVDWIHDRLVVRSGVQDWIRKNETQASANQDARDLKRLLSNSWIEVATYVFAAGYTALTFLVRLLVLVLALPLFATAAFIGFVDGLVKRDLRRFGVGRESGFLYHRARALIRPLILAPSVVYLALPVSLPPLVILLPGALLLGAAVNTAVATFKKYL
jgi:integrating conjugative element membrane protein (TIGR03747 family)